MKKQKLTIAMAGWGSGGHVYPIKSLIEFLASEQKFYQHIQNIYWFGHKNSLEQKEFLSLAVQKWFQTHFVTLFSWKLRREKSLKAIFQNIRDIFLFILWFFQSLYFIHKYKIDIIFCKWGHVSAPVVLAWALLRKKIIAHESDTHPWLASRIATPFASRIFTWFDGVFSKAETVGQILSDDIYFDPTHPSHSQNASQLSHIYQHKENKTIVLVVGWSLWSKSLYDTLYKVLEQNSQLLQELIFVVVGGFINTDISHQFDNFDNVFVFDYLSQKEMAMACYYADIGLTRGGTTSLAEQKLYNMKLLIVPIPRTHDQYDNANYYLKKYQDILIDQQKDFQKHLTTQLKHIVWYHKKRDYKNIKEQIHQTKTIIANALIQKF